MVSDETKMKKIACTKYCSCIICFKEICKGKGGILETTLDIILPVQGNNIPSRVILVLSYLKIETMQGKGFRIILLMKKRRILPMVTWI